MADNISQDGGLNRRGFMHTTAAAVGSWAVPLSFDALLRRAVAAGKSEGFGPLRPTADETTGLELLQLPTGFRYCSFGWTGDMMSDNIRTPGAHDGMGVIRTDGNVITLVRNHEHNSEGTPFAPAETVYDRRATGGCTNLQFDTAAGRWIKAWSSLGGTVRNCAGGPTPWGTWLSCEETVLGPGSVDKERTYHFEQDHGYIFEVSHTQAKAPQPLKAMGRFVHEAVAVDPRTGIVYETEDAGTAGFYRFIPKQRGELAQGGKLQMMKVTGRDDLMKGVTLGQPRQVTWVDIEDPTRAHAPGTQDGHGVYAQGKQQRATTFARLEGCWYGNESIYIVSTSGGDNKAGQVFRYEPEHERITCIFESPGAHVVDSPDNITVSPRGGMVLCEDGEREPQKLHGLTQAGQVFELAANNVVLHGTERNRLKGDFRNQEWCGATFSPDGRWLFVNLQTPGITLAVTGPWEAGGL